MIQSFIHNYATPFISSDYASDRHYYGDKLFSLRSNQGRLISVIDVTSQISVGTCTIVGITVTRIASFIFRLAREACKTQQLPSPKETFIAVLVECLLIGYYVIQQLVIRTIIVGLDILGIALPEYGRRGRLIFQSREQIFLSFTNWLNQDWDKIESDAYNTLELTENKTPEEARKAYKKLAMQYHPDKNPTGGEKFQKISQAHRILCEDPRTLSQFIQSTIVKYSGPQ